jgi:hypothetical protein
MYVDVAGGVRAEDGDTTMQQLPPSHLGARCSADDIVVLVYEDPDLGLRIGCDQAG